MKILNKKFVFKTCLISLVCILGFAFTISSTAITPSGTVCRGGSKGWNQIECYLSPDGNKILYSKAVNGCPANDDTEVYWELWMCDTDGSDDVQICTNAYGDGHKGGRQKWIDDEHFVYCGMSTGDQKYFYFMHTNGTVSNSWIGYNYAIGNEEEWDEQLIMYHWGSADTDDPDKTHIYTLNPYNGNNSKFLSVCDFVAWDATLDGGTNTWTFVTHVYNSPNGGLVYVDIRDENRNEHIFSCDTNGENIAYEFVRPYLMHACAYSEGKFWGSAETNEFKYIKLYDIDTGDDVTVAGVGNHSCTSPSGKLFVGESYYNSEPVSVWLYKYGSTSAMQTSDTWNNFAYEGPDEGHYFHVDPAFSHDGRTVYYNKAYTNSSGDKRCDVIKWDISDIIKYDGNFNEVEVEGMPAGWEKDEDNTNTEAKVVENPSGHNRSLKMKDRSTTGGCGASYAFDSCGSGKVVTFVDQKHGSGLTSASIQYRDSSNNKYVSLRITNSGLDKALLYEYRDSSTSNIYTFDNMKWYTFRLIVDVDTDEVTIYAGEQYESMTKILTNALSTYDRSDVAKLRFATGNLADDMNFYIDNVCIYTN